MCLVQHQAIAGRMRTLWHCIQLLLVMNHWINTNGSWMQCHNLMMMMMMMMMMPCNARYG
jgi:hypothetical protein